jgi:YegS/Rv2252/BmrU family lipid kinase
MRAMPDPVLIVNPNSAGGQTRRRWAQLEATLRAELGAFHPLFTERPGHATELARGALRDGAELIVAMGGDGTLNEVVNGFFEDGGRAPLRADAALGLLPAGTGGDFPKTIGLPKQLRDAARMLASARPRPVDVGRLEYLAHDGKTAVRHFINIASFGIGGLVDRYVNQSSKALGGTASFFLASLRASIAYKNAEVRLRLDDNAHEVRTVYSVAVANGRYFGGGMKMAPDAALDDGLFDVVTIGDVGVGTMIRHTSKIYSGTHIALPFVRVERARRVIAESTRGEEVLLDVDGEQPGRLPATFELLPGAVRVMHTA